MIMSFIGSRMSEADRVFARMTPPGSPSVPEDKELLHIVPRRRGTATSQSRVVEVVHRRSARSADAPRPEGFQARSGPVSPPLETPIASPDPAPQVGHVMPGWEPLLLPIEPETAPAPPQRQPKTPAAPKPRKRAFADPFAAEDTGANCFRCGYLIEAAREKRGLMTCARCG